MTVIFSDGFESGNFSAWTGDVVSSVGGESISIIDTLPHHDTYSFQSTIPNDTNGNYAAYIYKTFTGVTNASTRVYWTPTTDAGSGANCRIFHLGHDSLWGRVITVSRWFRDGGGGFRRRIS